MNSMNRIGLTILFACMCTFQLSAQFRDHPVLNIPTDDLKPYNWGYFLGFNQYDFKFTYDYNEPSFLNNSDVIVTKNTGFIVGLIGEMRINKFADLRIEPGLHSSKRILAFPISASDSTRTVKSTYIDIPLLLKLSAERLGNWRPFIVGGPSISYNLSSQENTLNDNANGTFRLKTWSINYQLGLGIDFYLPYFKFTPSLRGVFGLKNELVYDATGYTQEIANLNTRGVFLVFTFE